MTTGSGFKSLIKIGSAASVVLRKMCREPSKFSNVQCATQSTECAMYNTKCTMSYVEHKMGKLQCAACNKKKKDLSNAPHHI